MDAQARRHREGVDQLGGDAVRELGIFALGITRERKDREREVAEGLWLF
jgi:hypothetical protein